MFESLGNAWKKLSRDVKAGRSPAELVSTSTRYVVELASARLYLSAVNEVGAGVRTL